ncbi:transmembrane protein 254 isoform X1 [Hyla sarda]|uniref:transmembrane protein 254 isoform X1 n=1 Tax=Hyla sarda TaxID=327740 RepID=UPI0024C3BA36|nr:transmembrane protein 254 isoform X1 [Hyla sarda]
MASAGSASYFRRAGILWMALISLAMGFFTWTVFWPTQVPYEQLGPIGSFAQYMVKNHYGTLYNGFWLAWAVHAAEALYTVRLCSTKGITDPGARMQWLMQTFLFGIASLSLLLAYKPGKKKR